MITVVRQQLLEISCSLQQHSNWVVADKAYSLNANGPRLPSCLRTRNVHFEHSLWYFYKYSSDCLVCFLNLDGWIANEEQASAVADKPARRAASRQTCCKERWTLGMINVRPFDNACDGRRFRVTGVIRRTSPILAYPTCIWRLRWGWPCLSFVQIFGQKGRVHGLSCGVTCVIIRLAISAEHRFVTEGHTTAAHTAIA